MGRFTAWSLTTRGPVRPGRLWVRLGALLGACALVIAVTSGARADAGSEARQRYERALKLYEEGIYDAALVELKRAYELRPSYKLLYNIAQVRLAMNDYAAAVEAFEDYLHEGADQIPADRREAVGKELQRLQPRVASLTIKSDVSGAEVLVDDLVVGTTPLAHPVLVNSGVRRVVVRHPGYPPQGQRVSVPGGEAQEVSLPLMVGVAAPAARPAPAPAGKDEPEARASVAPAASPQRAEPAAEPEAASPASPKTGKRKLAISWGITGALAAGAAVTGVLALMSGKELADKRENEVVDAGELDAKAERTTKLALISDGLTVVAAVSGVLSVWFSIDARRDRRAETQRAKATRMLPELALGVSPGGLGLRARY